MLWNNNMCIVFLYTPYNYILLFIKHPESMVAVSWSSRLEDPLQDFLDETD